MCKYTSIVDRHGMSDSYRDGDPYSLLKSYMYEARILSLALSYREKYYRKMAHCLTYPLVVLSATASVLSGLDMDPYLIMSINLTSLILIGFNQLIAPKEQQFLSNTIKNEFSEIQQSIQQFISENNKTSEQIKQYSQIIFEQLKIWKSLSPDIKTSYIKTAKGSIVEKVRPHMVAPCLHSISPSKKRSEKKEPCERSDQVPDALQTAISILQLNTIVSA